MPGMTCPVIKRAVRFADASMRPRLNAGDDRPDQTFAPVRPTSFNEAPAKCRG